MRDVGNVRRVIGLSVEGARDERAFRRAVGQMPRPVPWERAAPRLIPVIAGPIIDPPGERCVGVQSELGPIVEIGLGLGAALPSVDVRVAERWECSPSQLMERALRNLGERAARISVDRVQTGVMSGRSLRVLCDRPRWASSLLLSPNELFRLFGTHDQVLAAPTTHCLLSLPLETPSVTLADIVVDFERSSRRPLYLDPFLIAGGELRWAEPFDEDEELDPSTS